ncbi:MAG TPA: VCBS repeat-containing protein, partial [bacterium]|nr:VCBS repeat-containing protein [bacterium]
MTYLRTIALALFPLHLLGGAANASLVFERDLEPFPMATPAGPEPRVAYGGWSSPRPQWLDVDGDGDLDLFVAEEVGKLRFYRNAGSAFTPDWVLETDEYGGVHRLVFARVTDADSDGDFDLLVEAPTFEIRMDGAVIRRTGAYLYTNTGTRAAPVFTNLSPHPDGYLADEAGVPIPFDLTAPDLVDLDGDGDRDLFTGRTTGELALYRNVGAPGGAPVLRLESESYGGIVLVPGSCGAGPVRAASPRHGYMILSWFDLEADGLPDLFVGDEFNPNVYHLANLGGGPSPGLECRTDLLFPGQSGGSGFFPQRLLVTFGDVDGDGDPDALFGSGVSTTTGLFLMRNDGSASSPAFVHATDDYLPELDLGSFSAPAPTDRDGDGDPDLFLGTGSGQAVTRWENVGSAAAPDFLGSAGAWASVPNSGWNVPELGDLDDDGDADLLVGGSAGEIRWFRNDGGAGPGVQILDDPDFGNAADRTFRSVIDARAVPRLVDVDADGDPDVVAGYFEVNAPEAALLLFRNDGTAANHRFVAASADFAGIGPIGQGTAPAFGDLDGNGSADLVVGLNDGTLVFLRNVGTPAHAAYLREDAVLSGIDVGSTAIPGLADLDADGDLDLLVGETGGGLNFFRNRSASPAPPDPPVPLEPAADAPVSGREPLSFRWTPSFVPGTAAEATYELRLTADPAAPPTDWTVIPATRAELSVHLYSLGFRFAPEIWWSVVARNGEWPSASLEWRRAVHTTIDTLHEDDEAVG